MLRPLFTLIIPLLIACLPMFSLARLKRLDISKEPETLDIYISLLTLIGGLFTPVLAVKASFWGFTVGVPEGTHQCIGAGIMLFGLIGAIISIIAIIAVIRYLYFAKRAED